MSKSIKQGLYDPRYGERAISRWGFFLVPFATLTALLLADNYGELERFLPLVLLIGACLFGTCLICHFAIQHWAMIEFDQDSLLVVREKKEIRLPTSSVAKIDWSHWDGIVLWTDDGLQLQPGRTSDREQRLRLYRFLRSSIPEERQRHWPQFCQKNLDWLDAWHRQNREPQQGEFLMTRRLFDRNWFWVIPLSLLDGGIAAVVSTHWELAVAIPLSMLTLLAFARMVLPPGGEVRPKNTIANWWLPLCMLLINIVGGFMLGAITAFRSNVSGYVAIGESALLAAGIMGALVLFAGFLLAAWIQANRFPINRAADQWATLAEELRIAETHSKTG
ncbi:hypothetical protein M4951_21675 [Blastopirellula sp. J2-11]|uniref:hypothetical protein n=1 Tax=Blastopirellula sp. J2-11 TaxID=2943192 RepID=UPI0021C95EB1|nr:hypothetical protein [Blastopirellula sp. J2-11]UUO05964.1 hypothetical protein M4951_21675 [Blastopirellula sp. J2-11]